MIESERKAQNSDSIISIYALLKYTSNRGETNCNQEVVPCFDFPVATILIE